MIYLRLYWAFFKIGALGFGGGLAIIQLIYDSIQAFTTMTAEQFANIVAIAQVTPGPVAINAATYVGFETAGFFGSLVATIGVATPAFILISIISRFMNKYLESRAVQGALAGVRPAVVGMIANAALTVGIPTLISTATLAGIEITSTYDIMGSVGTVDILALIMVVATVILIGKFKIGAIKVFILMGVIGALIGA